MKSTILLSTLLAATITFPSSGLADGFGASGSGAGFTDSGTLTTTFESPGEYLITDISGAGFTGLFPTGGFQGNDNLLFPSAAQYVDSKGFSFTIDTGEDTDNVDISSTPTGYQAYIVDEGGNVEIIPVTFNLTPDDSGATPQFFSLLDKPSATFAFTVASVSPTPEPSSLALLGTGLVTVIAARRRRRSLTIGR